MTHLFKWLIVIMATMASFVLAWLLLHSMGFEQETILAFAPVVSAAALSVGAWYAERGRGGGVRRPEPQAAPQIILGDIPREPAAFQGREELARQVLTAVSVSPVTVVCALNGARGVGKTHLAAAYARRCIADGVSVVVWISAEDPVGIMGGMTELSEALGLREPTQDAELAAASARSWLERNDRSALLVFDNAVDPDALLRWLPRVGPTQILITSNVTTFSYLGTSIDVGVFSPDEAVAFVQERSGRYDPDGAAELAEEVGFLPLALAQAAWWMRRRSLGFAEYLGQSRALPVEDLLARVPGEPYPRGAAESILLTVAEIDSEHELVRPVSEVIALLSPNGTNRGLLYKAFPERSADEVDAALAALSGASVLVFDLDGRVAVMHRLFQRVLRDHSARHGTLRAALAVAISCLEADLVPRTEDEVIEPERLTGFVEHVASLWEVARLRLPAPAQGETNSDETFDALLNLRRRAVTLLAAGYFFQESIALGLLVLEEHHGLLGEAHPHTIQIRRKLAVIYTEASDPALACPLRQKNVEVLMRTLGADAPETRDAVNSHGFSLETAGRLDEAIAVHEENLAHSLRVLGPGHQTTLRAQINLASCNRSSGRDAEALELFEKNFADNVRAYGLEQPSTLNARGELARMYERIGQGGRAVNLHIANIADYRRLGLATVMMEVWWVRYLALAMQTAGRTGEAVELLESLLDTAVTQLSEGHPSSISVRLFLARALQADGRAKESVQIFREVVAARERLLGPDNGFTLNSRRNLANALLESGRRKESFMLIEQVVADYERVLGTDHPYTVTARTDLDRIRHTARRRLRCSPG